MVKIILQHLNFFTNLRTFIALDGVDSRGHGGKSWLPTWLHGFRASWLEIVALPGKVSSNMAANSTICA